MVRHGETLSFLVKYLRTSVLENYVHRSKIPLTSGNKFVKILESYEILLLRCKRKIWFLVNFVENLFVVGGLIDSKRRSYKENLFLKITMAVYRTVIFFDAF